jgi:lysozyme family protein
MSAWEEAAQHILKVEGGYVNDPKDPGGATNYGISIRFLKDRDSDHYIHELADGDHDGDVDVADIKGLTVDRALTIYKYAFWIPNKYDQFSDKIAVKLFDMAVNMGAGQANKQFQRALGADDDGQIGPDTIKHYTSQYAARGEAFILESIRAQQKHFYDELISKHPQLAKFRKGWYNRADSL